MKVHELELHFKGTHNLITAPVMRSMKIQDKSIGISKRSEHMKEFRIIGALAHVMMDVPERLIHVNDLNEKLLRYVLKKAWPLGRMDLMHQVVDVQEHYEDMSNSYHEQDWESMGVQLAEIAEALHDDLEDRVGKEEVKKQDEYEESVEHA